MSPMSYFFPCLPCVCCVFMIIKFIVYFDLSRALFFPYIICCFQEYGIFHSLLEIRSSPCSCRFQVSA